MEEYGAIVIRIVDDSIKQNIVKTFVDSLTRYVSLTKNQVGLGIIIGEDVTSEAEKYVNEFSRRREDWNKPSSSHSKTNISTATTNPFFSIAARTDIYCWLITTN